MLLGSLKPENEPPTKAEKDQDGAGIGREPEFGNEFANSEPGTELAALWLGIQANNHEKHLHEDLVNTIESGSTWRTKLELPVLGFRELPKQHARGLSKLLRREFISFGDFG